MKKILLFVPSYEWKLSIDFFSFLHNIIVPDGYTIDISFSVRTLIDTARNMAVKKCIEWKYEYLFFVDDDTIPDKNVLVKMVSNDVWICSWVYRSRWWDNKILLWNKEIIDDKPFFYNVNKINIALWVVQKVDACWGWCLLIKRTVLEDMVKEYWPNIFKLWDMQFKWWPVYLSEDISFCEMATSMMYSINVDTRCKCSHNGICMDKSMYVKSSYDELTILITQDNYDKMRKHLLNNIKSNFDINIVNDCIDKHSIENAADYVMYVWDIEIPYWLDVVMIQWLEEAQITWPLTIVEWKWTFRNDNIVTHCWIMKKEDLLKILPVPTKLEDFTIYRNIKKKGWQCWILNSTIKMNGW